VGFGNLVNATAIGANAVVSQSNALVLGDSLIRIGPCFAEQFQSDRRIDESEWTAH